jgi:hypothetical protein
MGRWEQEKISQKSIIMDIEENVLWLQVPMDDIVLVRCL